MNRNRLIITLCALALLCTAFICRSAQARSIFFTPAQVAQIDAALLKTPQALATQSKHLFHLGSIFYIDHENWTIWAQGEKWTPVTRRERAHILAVTPTAVTMNIMLHNGRTLSAVTLRPHQSLNLLTGKIVEGL